MPLHSNISLNGYLGDGSCVMKIGLIHEIVDFIYTRYQKTALCEKHYNKVHAIEME